MAKKNSLLLWGGLGVLAFLLMSNTSGAGSAVPDIDVFIPWINEYNYDDESITLLHEALTKLSNIGYAGSKLKLALSQVMFEMGMQSPDEASQVNNNLTGIMWINNPSVQKNATRGLPMPGINYYYANFATLQDWANDYNRIVNDPPYAPIANAVDPYNFASLLYANGYYTGDQTAYAAGLTKYWNQLGSVGF